MFRIKRALQVCYTKSIAVILLLHKKLICVRHRNDVERVGTYKKQRISFMIWHLKTFEELTNIELYQLLVARTQVFVVE